ncbi:hypothetical protein [Aerococcus urinae]|uniref:Uncharacterized protein n=1 Tax=Aerococcus urinae TaxID=1376 RepID=A0A0X8FFK2_9LACT|nr:hypothetical protein [Aerococcus urinae]AMB96407.1 hypothetical protein AWM73_07795 [Aerococcus urinae]MCY3032222.1 hypothetical protein [Aerococcus urinae]MCY3037728.1 hypothetical protein [Aerococcus urinae]MCY3044268.1 hypothetical protein [Aerococcus urinae]MCY3045606.1 hypothetical protein [Aerococcus urinae]
MTKVLSARLIKIGNSQAIILSKTASELANFHVGEPGTFVTLFRTLNPNIYHDLSFSSHF